uniref:Uncharacterized protein n=1 Tax=Rhizophora mucronata TaxID=61149 RepID=A0A2P2Q7X1_RHIMU
MNEIFNNLVKATPMLYCLYAHVTSTNMDFLNTHSGPVDITYFCQSIHYLQCKYYTWETYS